MPQLQFSIDWGALVAANTERVQAAMAERSLDLILVNNVDSVRYLTGYSTVNAPGFVHVNWVVLGSTGPPVLFALPFYVRSIRRGLPWLEEVRPLPASMPRAIADLAREGGVANGRIGFDGSVLHGAGREIEALLPDASHVPAEDVLVATRMIKSPAEIEIMRRSVAIAEIGMKAAIESAVEGALEYEVAAIAEYAMRSAGAEGVPYSAVVSSGENAAAMQEISSDAILRRGDFVMFDLGCLFEGYCAEFARSVVVGGAAAATPDQAHAYASTYRALQELVAAIRPGARCADLDAIARDVLTDAGYGEHLYDYFVGHGIGMGVWEPPILDAGAPDELVAGMVINVEPGIHRPGLGGLRLEQTVLVTETGHEVLTRTEFCDELI